MIEERFEKKGIPFYVDSKHGALHAKCTDGEMWTVLSGREATWALHQCRSKLEPEFINSTIVGTKLKPPVSAIKANKLLEICGFQKKVDGDWKATKAGQKYCHESESSYDNKTFLRWDWNIIEILQTKTE